MTEIALQAWQAIRYGNSDETRAALAYYRERGWPVDNQHANDERLEALLVGFRCGYRDALLAQPPAPVTPQVPQCRQLVATAENATDCSAHLAEGRIFPCRFTGEKVEHAERDCVDYEAMPLPASEARPTTEDKP